MMPSQVSPEEVVAKSHLESTDIEKNLYDTSPELSGSPSLQPCVEDKNKSEFTPRACLCLIGSFSALFCSIGFLNAFGVFQEYYSQELLANKSKSAISWIGAFNLFIMFGMTIFVGLTLEKKGPQFLLIIGSTIIILALFMISLCKEYYQIFLAQGVLLGLGMSFVMLPAVATVPKYFNRSRGLALGITIGGSSLGGVIWPIALRHVLVDVGYGWGFRIAAFIMLPLLAIACLTIRAPEDLSAANQADPDLRVFNNPALMIFAGGLFFLFLGLFAPLFFVPSWAIEQGLDSNMAFYMLSIINAASLFGRLIPGLLADKFGAFNMMIVVACTMGLVACCWTKATSLAGIIVFCVAFGFSSGGVISLQSACGAQLVAPENYGIVMGSVVTFVSIPVLIGPPIEGQILEAYHYLGLSLSSGLASLVGMMILIIARMKINSRLLARV